MKKLLIFALAAFAFAACKDDDKGETKYSVTVENGTANPASAVADTEITITANEAPAGDQFANWSFVTEEGAYLPVEFDDPASPETFFVMPKGNVKVIANFGDVKHVLTIEGENDLYSVDASIIDANGQVAVGTEVVLTYVPKAGYENPAMTSEDVTLDGPDADNGYSFIMPDKAVTLTVTADLTPFAINVDGGEADLETATAGTTVTIMALKPNFTGWTSEDLDVATAFTEVEGLEGVAFTFEMPAKNVTLTANFDDFGTYPYLLYMSDDNVLDLGKWQDQVNYNNALETTAGSLVAFINIPPVFLPTGFPNPQGSGAQGWTAIANDAVKFWPVADLEVSYAEINYNQIPSWDQMSENSITTDGYFTSETYHNADNIATGRGDICKVVGLTNEQAIALNEAGLLHKWDSGYRLPTNAECQAFGYKMQGAPMEGSRHIVIDGDADSYLPAFGYRNNAGNNSGSMWGAFGYFWTSKPDTTRKAIAMCVDMANAGTAAKSSSMASAFGYNVRCVPNN